MSRLLEFFLYSQLKATGWPRQKGIFRKQYVDSALADVVISQGLQVMVGLGAGRPEVAVAMLADTFAGNPWTEETIKHLFGDLKRSHDMVDNRPDMSPWQALWDEHRLTKYSREWSWSDLFDDRVDMIRAMAASHAAYWGLTRHDEMQTLFDREKSRYEKSATEGNQYGLEVSNQYPFESLKRFYEWCDTVVIDFGRALSPFPEIPLQLRAVPEIKERLS